MSNPSPPKSRWTRMGSAMRRATAFTLPRASTPSIEGERDSDTASTKGSVRSLSINQPSVLLPPKSVASYPSPIPESPMNQDDSKLVTSAPVAQATMASESQSAASPVQEDAYTAPPVLNTGAVGPGGFTDNLDDIPPSQPIRDPSQLQSDSDGHDALAPAPAPAAEPTTTTGPGGFSDSDEIPQKPQSIKASSIQHTDSDSHRPPVVDSTAPRGFIDDDFSENNIAQAPSLKHAESTDNHQPSTIDSSAAGLGGFNDSFDDLHRPTVSREPSFQEPDAKVEPVTQITQPPVLAKPPAEPSTPVREYSAETSSYFDRPVATEPEPNPEATEQFKTQLNNVFPFLPMVETPEEANLSVAPKDEPFQPLQEMPVLGHAASDAPEMPTPEPVAHPSIIPEYTLTSFESGQEVWGGVAHHQVEDTVKRDVDIAASTRSRASSIRSMNTNDPFADPMVPRITVYHHDPDISSAMPQPQISDNYPQAPANRGGDPGVVSMPLPPMHEVIPSRSVSNQTPSNIVTDYHDERLPLLPQATSSKVASYLQPSAASRNIVNVSPQSDVPHTSLWPTQVVHQGPRLCDFGWIEYQLPDRTVYYVHPTRRVTADIDLRDEKRLDAINIYFERHGDGVSAPVGMELWLLEDGVHNGRRPFRPPRRFLVNHNLRMVTYDQTLVNGESGGRSRKAMEDDQIDIEYRYWYFMEAHPAHTALPPNARAEAMDVLTWAWTDRLLPAHHAVPAPFAQEECQELTSLLRSFGELYGANNASALTNLFRRTLGAVMLFQGNDGLSDVLLSI
ncbi:hypothetical protein C0989_003302 [Termitomyces sp. Mn162]|nr:hypothetical protein C0989_003302 [Termitomyces sp. Mn162]